jgi:ketopantoate reductase
MDNLDPIADLVIDLVADLVAAMEQAQAALTKGDTEAANVVMTAAAEICQGLQASGIIVPAAEMERLRELTARCGVELTRLGHKLNAESFRDDNHLRGIATYNNVDLLR